MKISKRREEEFDDERERVKRMMVENDSDGDGVMMVS